MSDPIEDMRQLEGFEMRREAWYVRVASNHVRRMSLAQVWHAWRGGLLGAATLVWTRGMSSWKPLGEVVWHTHPEHQVRGGTRLAEGLEELAPALVQDMVPVALAVELEDQHGANDSPAAARRRGASSPLSHSIVPVALAVEGLEHRSGCQKSGRPGKRPQRE